MVRFVVDGSAEDFILTGMQETTVVAVVARPCSAEELAYLLSGCFLLLVSVPFRLCYFLGI